MPTEISLCPLPTDINRPERVTRDLIAAALGALIDPFLVVSLLDMRGPPWFRGSVLHRWGL